MDLVSPEVQRHKNPLLEAETQASGGKNSASTADLLMGKAISQVKLRLAARQHRADSLADNPAAVLPRPCQSNYYSRHSSVKTQLFHIGTLSSYDSFPLGKCPLRWHSSFFPSESILSRVSATSRATPTWSHEAESQASDQPENPGALRANPTPQLSLGGKRVGDQREWV